MPRLSAAQTVDLWERGLDRPLPERAALLAELATPGLTPAQRARTSIGYRDVSILELRAATLGSRMACCVECAHCRARLEFSVDAGQLVDTAAAVDDAGQQSFEFATGDFRVAYRLPTGADVAASSARADDGEAARRELLARCIRTVMRADASPVEWGELDAATLDALEAELEARDPLATVSIATSCAACGQTSAFGLDVVAFFSAELAAIAKRLLAEVNVLARAYHWREADILAMSAVRRARYVEAALA